VTNVDRSPQNPNLLLWHGRLWLIDHGAALYLQHAWTDPPAEARRPFARSASTCCSSARGASPTADARLAPRLSPDVLAQVLDPVPEDWFAPRARAEYLEYLRLRLESPRVFVAEAEAARDAGLARSSTRSSASCRRSSAASA
jgi:hypothetical protein